MKGIARYKKVGVQSASNGQVLVMLMQGASLKLDQAAEEISEDPEGAVEKLRTVRKIYGELMAALDDSQAPEVCGNLRRLYGWCIRELAVAEKERDRARILGVGQVTDTLMEAWTGAVAEAG